MIRGRRVGALSPPALPDRQRLVPAPTRGASDGRTGCLTVIQRFGSGLNLNVHFHTLALDGVFNESAPGVLEFHPAAPPSDGQVAQVLARIRRRVHRLLVRRGFDPGDDGTTPPDALADESVALAGMVSASVQGRVALGPHAGARVRRLGEGPGGQRARLSARVSAPAGPAPTS